MAEYSLGESIHPEIVDSLNHPQAQLVRELLEPQGRQQQGLFLIDDDENIQAALKGGIKIRSVFSTDWEGLSESLKAIPCSHYQLAWRTAKKIFEVEKAVRTFALAILPPPLSLIELLSRSGDVVVLDQLALAGNAGAIIRTSLALEAAGLVLLGNHDLTDRRLIRASRGYVFLLPIVVAEPHQLLRMFDSTSKVLSVATAKGEWEVESWSTLPGDRLILLGSEKHGPSDELLARAQERVRIPMSPHVESLNVSVAAGVLLFARLLGRRGLAKMEP